MEQCYCSAVVHITKLLLHYVSKKMQRTAGDGVRCCSNGALVSCFFQILKNSLWAVNNHNTIFLNCVLCMPYFPLQMLCFFLRLKRCNILRCQHLKKGGLMCQKFFWWWYQLRTQGFLHSVFPALWAFCCSGRSEMSLEMSPLVVLCYWFVAVKIIVFLKNLCGMSTALSTFPCHCFTAP